LKNPWKNSAKQFIVKAAQEGQSAAMIRRERGRAAEKIFGLGEERLGDFAEFFQARVSRK